MATIGGYFVIVEHSNNTKQFPIFMFNSILSRVFENYENVESPYFIASIKLTLGKFYWFGSIRNVIIVNE